MLREQLNQNHSKALTKQPLIAPTSNKWRIFARYPIWEAKKVKFSTFDCHCFEGERYEAEVKAEGNKPKRLML